MKGRQPGELVEIRHIGIGVNILMKSGWFQDTIQRAYAYVAQGMRLHSFRISITIMSVSMCRVPQPDAWAK